MLPKERDDPFKQILASTNDIAVKVFPVVVMPPVHIHLARTKEFAQVIEAGNATRSLRHDELVRDLVPGCVAASARPAWLPDESDREATFSVYKTNHPTTKLDQSFLLIFRTRHVVTMVNALADVTR